MPLNLSVPSESQRERGVAAELSYLHMDLELMKALNWKLLHLLVGVHMLIMIM